MAQDDRAQDILRLAPGLAKAGADASARGAGAGADRSIATKCRWRYTNSTRCRPLGHARPAGVVEMRTVKSRFDRVHGDWQRSYA